MALPSELDGSVADLPDDNAAVLRELWEGATLRLHCVTWNMNAKDASVADLHRLFPRNRFHIYAVGTQECENTIARSLFVSSKERWEAAVTQAIGDKYTRLASHTLQATHLVVFVHSAVVKIINDVQTASVACGVGNALGNKGGCAVGFNVGKTALLFVTSHLAAKQRAVRARNRDFRRIEAALPLIPSGFGFEAQRAVAAELGVSAAAVVRSPSLTPSSRIPSILQPPTPQRGRGALLPLQSLPQSRSGHIRAPSAFPPSGAAHPTTSSAAAVVAGIGFRGQGAAAAAAAGAGPGRPEGTSRSERGESAALQPPLPGSVEADGSDLGQTVGPTCALGGTAAAVTAAAADADEDDEDGPDGDGGDEEAEAGGQSPRAGSVGSGDAGSSGGAAKRSLHDLLESLRVPEHASDRYDRVVWMGDLNYRVDLPRARADELVKAGDLAALLERDQLNAERAAGRAFAGFAEGTLAFPPTYKLDRDSDMYDSSEKQRVPSWTDRILYKPAGSPGSIELLRYCSEPSLRSSDHRPVMASFRVSLRASRRRSSEGGSGAALRPRTVTKGTSLAPEPVSGTAAARLKTAVSGSADAAAPSPPQTAPYDDSATFASREVSSPSQGAAALAAVGSTGSALTAQPEPLAVPASVVVSSTGAAKGPSDEPLQAKDSAAVVNHDGGVASASSAYKKRSARVVPMAAPASTLTPGDSSAGVGPATASAGTAAATAAAEKPSSRWSCSIC